MKEAMFYHEVNGHVQCTLCPHKCLLAEGHFGLCKVRQNINGKLYALGYGKIVSIHEDPIEKKPLYHFHPKQHVLSVGFSGCNMQCSFCQNYQISQQLLQVNTVDIEEVIEHIEFGIAFTYNEPTVNYEYVYELATRLKQQSPEKKIILVTNGMIEEAPLKKLLPFIDAFNLDLKGDEKFYEMCKGNFESVVQRMAMMHKKHLEVTTLLVNNEINLDNVDYLASEVAKIDPDIPYHLTRYYPNYQMTHSPTEIQFMLQAKKIADHYLNHVYLGNVLMNQSTYCKSCKNLLVERHGYDVDIKTLVCPCGTDNNIIGV